ncbi:MAG TPA: hypothetical protein VN325_28840 [Steroidobacteraceae bacterium]|nr:hypothetical protein [Steroidobacteraceae bacterium]
MPTRVLVKTTIGTLADDWHVGRFSLLTEHLRSLKDSSGGVLYAVAARDRSVNQKGDDTDLVKLADGAYDQLWLIGADETGALTSGDIDNVAQFRRRGGGVLLTRDHQDLGACLTRLGALGATQYFQTANPDPDESHRYCDDLETPSISWPNYHSGANGGLQMISAVHPVHALMRGAAGTAIRRLPAHPHEGSVGVPTALGHVARVVAQGRSVTTGAGFNLCVAVEEPGMGRAVSDSSFHHFCDYNWNPRLGCPSFVNEPVGDDVLSSSDALDDGHRYVENIAAWLAGRI